MFFKIRLYFVRLIKFLFLFALLLLLVSLLYALLRNKVIDMAWFNEIYPERLFDAIILALLLPFFRKYKSIRMKVDNPETELEKINNVLIESGYQPEKDIHTEKLYQYRVKDGLIRFFTLNENRIFIHLGKKYIELTGMPQKVSKILKKYTELETSEAEVVSDDIPSQTDDTNGDTFYVSDETGKH